MKILAVSGGVDSMVLLNLLKKEKVAVVHINHHTRGEENLNEEKLVESICFENHIPFYKFDYVYDGKGNFQNKARMFRYEKLKYISEKYSGEVYTAHHFDDQIENILMNPKKIGSKLIKKKDEINGLVVHRPLINKTKQEIYKYAKINNVKYMEDSSNLNTKYQRNFIRKKLADYTYEQKEKIYLEEKYRSLQIEELIKFYNSKKIFNINDINFTLESIYSYLKSQGITSNISINKLENIIDFLNKNKNGQIQIDETIKLVNSYSNIFILEIKKSKIEEKIEVLKNKEYNFNGIKFIPQKSGYLRTAKAGEKYKILNGSKKISRFFIDEKIPKDLRNRWPILVDQNNEIQYIPKMKDVTINEEKYGTRVF